MNPLLTSKEESRYSNDAEENIAFKATTNMKCFKCNRWGHSQYQCKMCAICKKHNNQEKEWHFKMTPIQCKICKKTNHIETIRIILIGSTVYAKILEEPVRKLDARSKKLIMGGNANHGYRLWKREK